MAERFLLAVDDSEGSRRAVAYVGRILGSRPDVSIMLFHHVTGGIPAFLVQPQSDPKVDQAVQQAMSEWAKRAETQGEQLLADYRRELVKAGIADSAITVKHKTSEARPEASRTVAALAIIDEVKAGGYTTVVLGRSGGSNLPEPFMGGVAAKVSGHVGGVTFWIVG